VYIETSAPRRPGDKAQLVGPTISLQTGQAQCFSFWYNMLGDHIKALNVYAMQNRQLGQPVFTRQGTQGAAWQAAQITISGPGTYQVRGLM